MSTTIDQRVVEMRFDNKHFESNVSTTMSTLDKLKQSLHLTGASKGLEEINSAANKVNMSGLSGAIDTVQAKFSALQVMGVTALANITNSAVNAGKRLVSSLTIEPITTGFNEYELKMDSVKTIMASTGESIDTVNKYLEELNTYSDQTIYSFSDMTENIGKFTNAGVKLEDAVLAIKGISNEAAVSGANANEASRAMYNFAQALSAGHVKLVDWKSIELANMATVEFKNLLLESAVAAGTLTKSADGMYKTLEGKTLSATYNFNETLQDEWMTTEVLVNTLKDYADETTDIGKKAFAAAQDVTKFTQMLDVLKETAQSGWAKTWELLFGDLEQAKAIFTPLTKFLSNIIDGMSNFRNNLLEGALSSPFGKLAERLETVTGVTETMTTAMENYGDIVDKVINGDFGNGQARWDALTEAGYDWAHVQNLVNEKLGDSTRHATDYKEAQEEVNKTQGKTIEQLLKLTDYQLKNNGFTQVEIEALRELEKQSEKTGIPIEDLIKDMDQLDGRTLLINSLKNAGQGLVSVCKAIKIAWLNAFPPMTSLQLYDAIAAVHKFSTHLKVSGDTFNKLTRTLKGVFAILDIITTLTGGGLKIAFKLLNKILEHFDLNILDVTASAGDAIVKFRDWLDTIIDFDAGFTILIDAIESIISAVRKWIDAFMAIPKVQSTIEKLKSTLLNLKNIDLKSIGENVIAGFKNGLGDGAKKVIQTIIDIGTNLITKFCDLLGICSPSKVFMAIGGFIIAGLLLGLKEGLISVPESLQGIVDKCTAVIEKIDWGNVFAAGASIAGLIFIKKIGDALSSFASVFDGVGDILSEVAGVVKNFAGVVKICQKVVKSFSKVLNGISFDIKMNGVKKLAVALAILTGCIIALTYFYSDDMWKAVGVIGALAGILIGLAFVMNALSSASIKWTTADGLDVDGLKTSLLGIAAAIAILGLTVKLIGSMDPDEIRQGFLVLAGVVVAILSFLAISQLIAKIDASGNIEKFGSLMTKLSISLLLMVGVCKLIGMLSAEEMIQGGVFVGAFIGFISLLSLISMTTGEYADKLGSMMIKMSFALGLMVVVCKLAGMLSAEEMVKGGAFALGFSAFVGILVAVTKIGQEQQLAKLGGLLMSISVSLLLLVGVCKLVGMLSTEELIKGGAFVGAFVGLIAVLVSILKISNEEQIGKVAGTILAFSVAIGILAGVSVLLSLMNIEGLVKGITAVGILSVMMAMLVAATKGTQNVTGTVVAMAAAVAVLTASIALMSLIDPKKLVAPTIALGLLMGMFALIVKSGKGLAKESMTSLIVMASIIAELGLVLWGLSALDTRETLSNATALSLLLTSLSGALFILSKMKINAKDALTNILLLSAMALPLGLFVSALMIMDGIDTATDNVILIVGLMTAMTALLAALTLITKLGGLYVVGGIVALTAMWVPMMVFIDILKRVSGIEVAKENVMILAGLMTVMTVLLAALTIIGIGVPFAVLGIVALTAMWVPMMAFIDILKTISGIDIATNNINLLMNMMTFMTGILTQLAIIGPLALIGVAAMQALVILIGEIGLLAAAIGALVDKFPQIQTFIDTGLPILEQLAGSIGTMIGNFISGALTSISSSLPQIGTDLSAFMDNVQGFITGAKLVDDSVLDGTKNLAAAIIFLSAAEFVNGLVSFLPCSTSLAQLGLDLSRFMLNAQPFIMLAPLVKQESMEGVKTLAAAIMLLSAAEFVNGIVSLIPCSSSMAQLGTDLSEFMKNAQGFVELSKDVDPTAVAACKTLAEIIIILSAGELISGITSLISSALDFGSIEDQLVEFGKAVVAFSNVITENGGIDPSAIDAACKAGALVVELEKSLPRTGGWVQEIAGEQDLSKFAASCLAFGACITQFSNYVVANGGVNLEAVETAVKAGTLMSELQNSLPKTGGWIQQVAGEQDLTAFSLSCVAFAKCITAFSNEVSKDGGVNSKAIEAAVTAGNLMSELQNSLPKTGGWIQEIAGEQDLIAFGNSCAAFGEAMSKFPTDIAISDGSIESISKAGTAMAELQSIIPKTDGLIQNIAGETDLLAFATACSVFGDALIYMADITVSDDSIESIGKVGSAMSKLQSIIPKTDGLIQNIAGETDLLAFSLSCSAFGDALTKMSGLTIAQETIDSIGRIGTTLVTLQKAIPSDTWFDGKINLATFGTHITSFAAGLGNLSTITVSEETVTSIASVGGVLTSLQAAIPSDTWFDGKINLGTFGTNISTFGDAINKISEIKITEDVMASITNAGNSLIALQKSIPEDKWLDGKVTLDEFGETIKSFGTKLVEYSNKVSEIDNETVSSSINQANRLVTLAKGLVDLDTSGIDKFNIKGIGSAMKDYAGEVEDIDAAVVYSSVQSANALKSLIYGLVGLDTSGISLFNIQPIGEKMSAYSIAVTGINIGAISSSIEAANKLKSFINSLASLNTSGVGSFKTAIENLGKIQVGNITKVFNSAASSLSKVGSSMMDRLAEGMRSKQNVLTAVSTSATGDILKSLKKSDDSFNTIGIAFMNKLASGMESRKENVVSSSTDSMKSSVTAMRNYYDSFYNAGSYLVDGFASGISANSFKAEAKAAAMAKAAKEAAEEALGIASPSKVFYKIGDYTGQGFVKALGDYGSKSYNAASDMADYARNGLSDAISKIKNAINGDLETQPTIRPVVDLSDVESGASAISGLFNRRTSLGVMGNINAISSLENQNRGNDDVVSAINKLRKDLGNLGGTSYTIDGITYDDGSNISNLMESLVRAANIERRR